MSRRILYWSVFGTRWVCEEETNFETNLLGHPKLAVTILNLLNLTDAIKQKLKAERFSHQPQISPDPISDHARATALLNRFLRINSPGDNVNENTYRIIKIGRRRLLNLHLSWLKLLENYTARSISKSSDIVPAISGIVDILRE